MDQSERALLAETVRDALAGADDGDAVLAKLGWLDLLAAEPDIAIDVVFRALGETSASSSALDDVVLSALGVQPRAGLAVLLPPFGAWEPPGRVEAEQLQAAGLGTARSGNADELLVVCDANVATVASPNARRTAVRGIDPDARLQAVEVDAHGVRTTALDPARWERAVALARCAVSYQTAGAARVMLDLARAYAVDRVQFGHPVAHFQAVRHRLAEALVAIEALDATLAAATDEPGPMTAALAKAVAGRTARTVAAHCQQVLAGIGFTTDHPFHRYLKRTMLLDGLFGAADDVVVAIGRELVATRTVPTFIEL
jgi:hypothetical protein